MGKRCLAKLIKSSAAHAGEAKPAAQVPKRGTQQSSRQALPKRQLKHPGGHSKQFPGNATTQQQQQQQPLSQEEEEACGVGAAGSGDAFSTLLGMLSAGRGQASVALRRRRREADGQESETGDDQSAESEDEMHMEEAASSGASKKKQRKKQRGGSSVVETASKVVNGAEQAGEQAGEGDGQKEEDGTHEDQKV